MPGVYTMPVAMRAIVEPAERKKEPGMDVFNREHVSLKQQEPVLIARMSRGGSGMFLFGVAKTGDQTNPHKVTVGFVPNSDAKDIGIKGGEYGRVDFMMNKAGKIGNLAVKSPETAKPEAMTQFVRANFATTMQRFAGILNGSGGTASEGAEVLTGFVTSLAELSTIPAEKLPGLR
jgi:hypothetical protein